MAGNNPKKTWLTAVLLAFVALMVFLPGITNPTDRIFDEFKYVDPAKAMLAGTHDTSPDGPPLGKLILAGSIRLLGDNPLGWRIPSAIFGALTLSAVFLWMQLLLDDYALSLTAVALTLLDNFLYVFSRTGMMDIFLVGFALWAILAFTAALKLENLDATKRRALLACSGILLGLACACKWNGMDELVVIIAMAAGLFFWSRRTKNPEILKYAANLRSAGIAWFAVSFSALPALVYVATFWPYCRMLHLPFSPAGFMSLNAYIWHFHLAVVGNRTIIVPWYKWPLQTQPTRALSYLVGNWYVMWAGLVALLFCLRRFGRNLPETMVVMLYGANLLQWAMTPQSCMFYYYYFPAAIFLGLAIPVALYRLPARVYGIRLGVVATLPALCVFAYCFSRMAHLPTPFDCMLGCWP